MMERVEDIVRDCVRDIGYEQEKFHWNTLKVQNYLHKQSAHIARALTATARAIRASCSAMPA
jgi:S-adenosylmethionine synthetase